MNDREQDKKEIYFAKRVLDSLNMVSEPRLIIIENMEELRKSGRSHSDPVGEPRTLPQTTLEPRRIGYWIFKKYVGEDYYSCSCCGQEYPFPTQWTQYDIHEELKYCSRCGAKMVGRR